MLISPFSEPAGLTIMSKRPCPDATQQLLAHERLEKNKGIIVKLRQREVSGLSASATRLCVESRKIARQLARKRHQPEQLSHKMI